MRQDLLLTALPLLASLFLAGPVLVAGGAPAWADGYIIASGGLARECYLSAKLGKASDGAIAQCSTALDKDPLEDRDRAGTYINRGTLHLRRKAWVLALADFDAAIALQPNIGEGHVNRAAALIGLARPAEAVVASDRGLALNPSEPEKAYFNRATARELTGDVEGAYKDYLKASELAPDWEPPKLELKRFKVTPR